MGDRGGIPTEGAGQVASHALDVGSCEVTDGCVQLTGSGPLDWSSVESGREDSGQAGKMSAGDDGPLQDCSS